MRNLHIRNRSKERALNKSNLITLLFFGNLNLMAQVLTNLWEMHNMNNTIFFLIIVAYVCLSVARFYSHNLPGDRHNFYNFLFPNLQDPNSGNTPYLDHRLPLTAYIQWFYITFYSIDISMQQSGQFESSRSHVTNIT
jgi:hypothetical protein